MTPEQLELLASEMYYIYREGQTVYAWSHTPTVEKEAWLRVAVHVAERYHLGARVRMSESNAWESMSSDFDKMEKRVHKKLGISDESDNE